MRHRNGIVLRGQRRRGHRSVGSEQHEGEGRPHLDHRGAEPQGRKGIMSYKIVRMYQDRDIRSKTIRTGLTLKEAQEHCQDPETSSRTCTSSAGKARTKRCGPWFDGYEDHT